MIKQEKTKRTIEQEYIVSEQYICDMCKQEIDRNGCYDIKSYKYKSKIGSRYPEGTWFTEKTAYFCEDCAKKIEQIMIDNGVTFIEREVDF